MGSTRHDAPSVLVVDDDHALVTVLRTCLLADGYNVESALDGPAAVRQMEVKQPELVLLDVHLPGLDGWSLLRFIRARGATPVIMMTAAHDTATIVQALDEGADDYVPKPIQLRELNARIRAVFRRLHRESFHVGGLSIDDRTKTVQWEGRDIRVTPREYGILRLLASEPGRVFSDVEIVRRVWVDTTPLATPAEIKRYIYLLRRKIEPNPKRPRIVLTVPGFGYRLALY